MVQICITTAVFYEVRISGFNCICQRQMPYSHSLKLALYPVNLGLSARFFGGFDRLFLLRLWSLRKNGIKLVSMIPSEKTRINTRGLANIIGAKLSI